MPSRRATSYWDLRIDATVTRPIARDAEARRMAETFGLHGRADETLYDGFRLQLRTGQIVAVVGPSGAGKSLLLAAVARQVRGAVRLRLAELSKEGRSAAAVLRGGTREERLEMLSRCGLAEATALVTPARRLSGGQVYRLALAEALHRANVIAANPRRRTKRPLVVIADEFAATLDFATASALCRQVRKLITGSNVSLLAATPRAELLAVLRPDCLIVKPLGVPARIEKVEGGRRTSALSVRATDPSRWPVERGRLRDYQAMSRFHYLTGPPALHKRVHVIRTPPAVAAVGGPDIAAVLVVSPPLMHVRGRNVATNGRYYLGDRRAAVARLNAEVEAISRVIVHPVYRGCGLAVRLIRHVLRTRQRPIVEALAAMGAIHPMLCKAGLTHIGSFPGRRLRYHYYIHCRRGKRGLSRC